MHRKKLDRCNLQLFLVGTGAKDMTTGIRLDFMFVNVFQAVRASIHRFITKLEREQNAQAAGLRGESSLLIGGVPQKAGLLKSMRTNKSLLITGPSYQNHAGEPV